MGIDRLLDISLFAIANLGNLLLIGIFLARAKGHPRVEWVLGLIFVSLILPVAVAVILNATRKREWWTVALPLLLILFCLVELLLDYILKLDFRNTALCWPYIALYYLALLGMIGYSFSLGKAYGFITLSTYFLGLLATWYGHSR